MVFDVPSVRVGRVFGIPVEVNLSWLLIFALVAFSLATSYYPAIPQASGQPAWVMAVLGTITALLFFMSVLAHELSHSLVVRAEGGHVDRITLFLFGGVAQMDDEPRSPGREFLMASAGPGMSLLLSGVFFGLYAASALLSYPWWVWAPLQYLSAINFAVAVFNMLPGFPLDGGRVLRSVLWAITGDVLKATRIASAAGQLIGWLMVGTAVLGVINGQTNLIWFGLIGWFISSLAGQAYRQQFLRSRMEGVTVDQIMTAGPEYVSGEISLEQLVQHHFLGSRHSRYPVMADGAIIGLVTLPDVKEVERPDWPFVPVADVAQRDLSALVVPADAPVSDLIARLAGDRPGALLVVRDGRLVGIVTRADLLELVEEADAER